MERLRAHRREQAARGFPLLRGSASTFVLQRLVALDALTEPDRVGYADELSDLAEAGLLAPAERAALIARLPVLAEVERATQLRPDLRFQTVKSLARLAAEPGGIEGFIRFQGLTGAAAELPAPHVPSLDEAVPVAPARLRKAVLAAVGARFGGTVRRIDPEMEQVLAEVPGGRMVLNLTFAGKGGGALGRQLDYSFWADIAGRRREPAAYEGLWLLPAQWDLITAANVDAAAAHLVRLVETRLALE